MKKQITEADLKEGAKFRFENGTTFLILGVKMDKFGDRMVRSKLAQECFTNSYLNEVSDCIAFFNEQKAQLI
jgi:hypothetical protein